MRPILTNYVLWEEGGVSLRQYSAQTSPQALPLPKGDHL